MENNQSKLSLFFQDEKKKILFIFFVIIIMVCISAILFSTTIFSPDYNFTHTYSTLIEDEIYLLSSCVYIVIPQFIASKTSEKFRKRLYAKSGNKMLSLTSSISYYFIQYILSSFLLSMFLMALVPQDILEVLPYIIVDLFPFLLFVWLVSISLGVVSLVINSSQSETVTTGGKIPFRIYLSFFIYHFFALILVSTVFLLIFGG